MVASNVRLLTIAQICAELPGSRGAKRLNPATVLRWILTGCPSRTGERIRLRATRAGTRWLVARSDLEEFFERLAAEPPAAPKPTAPMTERKLAERAQRADDAMARRGA